MEISPELVQQMREKNEDAIRTFIQRTEKEAYFIAYSSVRNSETAKDLVQESYIKAIRNIHQLQDDKKIKAWFRQIINNTIYNYVEKKSTKTEKQSTVFSALDNEEDGLDFESSIRNTETQWEPENHIERQQIQEGIQEILQNDLSSVQRLAIIQFYYEGQTIHEIAENQQVSDNTVKGWLTYGKRKIKDRILELRANNTSFYAMAPMSILSWALQDQANTLSHVPLSPQDILSEVGLGTTIAGGSGIASWWAAQTTAAKIAITVTATAVTGAGAYQVPAVQDFVQQMIIQQFFMDEQQRQLAEQQRLIEEQQRLQQEQIQRDQQQQQDEMNRLQQEQQQQMQDQMQQTMSGL